MSEEIKNIQEELNEQMQKMCIRDRHLPYIGILKEEMYQD